MRSTEKYETYLPRNQRQQRNILFKNKETAFTGEIECSNVEPFEIKKEFIEDQDTTCQNPNQKYKSKWCSVYIKDTGNLTVKNKLSIYKEQTFQELEQIPEKKFKCEKCARSYKWKSHLNRHLRYECDVNPQFICKFCGKQFRRKSHMSEHIVQVHQKINSKKSVLMHKCDKCFRSYASSKTLNRHKRLDHAEIKQNFTCHICGCKMKEKSNLSKHIISQHLK
ncbi:zinc finger protein 90-like isoform X2 [Belonocnema kinseyi]|uniref:zinc finger protein 90-like isoform X2 n=1 Tax=Belonocnema kinseyi TaxID=2817044 RepID=UPI00143CE15E|nr:zinc finger protein 90-like isoform X2 [Belonocnema kinseyi]